MAFIEFINDDREDRDPVCMSSADTERTVICKSPAKLHALLNEIRPGFSVHYVSKGDWSMHDLIMQLLNKYSPADIFLSTYALRETPVRQFVLAQQSGRINSLQMLIDYRAKIRTPEVLQLAQMNANKIALIPIHAKVCVIKTAAACITIVTSSNLTSNPKIEAGVVSMDTAVGEFHIDWITKKLNSAQIFK